MKGSKDIKLSIGWVGFFQIGDLFVLGRSTVGLPHGISLDYETMHFLYHIKGNIML